MSDTRVFHSVVLLDNTWQVAPEENEVNEQDLLVDDEHSTENIDSEEEEVSLLTQPAAPDFEEERLRIIAEAQAEAEQITQATIVKAKDIEKSAYEKGFLAGKQQGIAEGQDIGKQEAEIAVKGLTSVIRAIEETRVSLVNEVEEKIISMVLEIARKVIREEVKQDKNIVINLVKDGIRRITEREKLLIRVNKGEVENLIENRDSLLACADGIKSIEFQEDGRVEAGGCIIETEVGTVDVRIDMQMAVVSEAFTNLLKEEV